MLANFTIAIVRQHVVYAVFFTVCLQLTFKKVVEEEGEVVIKDQKNRAKRQCTIWDNTTRVNIMHLVISVLQ